MKQSPHTNGAKPLVGYQALLNVLKFNEEGLIPAIIQDEPTRQVLTLCYLNVQAIEQSLKTGTVYLYRRSQRRLMQKGETSGHIQIIREVWVDCEGKSLLLIVRQHVAACHVGYFTCYYRRLGKEGRVTTVGRRVFDPAKIYTSGHVAT